MEKWIEKGNDFYRRIESLDIDDWKKPFIRDWLETHIFDKEGNMVYVENGRLKKEYPHKQLKRLYSGLPKEIVPLLHTQEIRRLWGTIHEDFENIVSGEYRQYGNSIVLFHRTVHSYVEDDDLFSRDVDFFLSLIRTLSGDNVSDSQFVLEYVSYIVQKRHYSERTERLLILYSGFQGTGKTLFATILAKIVGGIFISPDLLLSKFDAHRLGLKNLCVIDEGEALTADHYAIIKSLITADVLESPVKFEMGYLKVPSSFECIITTNKRPASLRNMSNRRDVVIECKEISFQQRELLFANFRWRDSLIGNIGRFLRERVVNEQFLRSYRQKEDLYHVAVNEIQALFKAFLEFSVLPAHNDRLQGDWQLVGWVSEVDTGMSRREWYELYLLYSAAMSVDKRIGYRFFIEEMKRVCGDSVDLTGRTVVFGSREAMKDRYLSIFVRDSIKEMKMEGVASFRLFLSRL